MAEDNVIFRKVTADRIMRMLDSFDRGFPFLRPRQRRRSVAGGGGDTNVAKLFQVQSSATGHGIYNCLPMVIDSEQWNVPGQLDIIDVVTEGDPPVDVTETEEILNLDETINITDSWALETTYADGDGTRHKEIDYQAILGHCAGGCVNWVAATWTIGDRCRYLGHAYILANSDKTSGDTTPPTTDGDWSLDDDEPGVGNAWENYWTTGPEASLSAGAMVLAFKVTDDEGVTRLVGRTVGPDFIEQFFKGCS